jgi:hypothetical protein
MPGSDTFKPFLDLQNLRSALHDIPDSIITLQAEFILGNYSPPDNRLFGQRYFRFNPKDSSALSLFGCLSVYSGPTTEITRVRFFILVLNL